MCDNIPLTRNAKLHARRSGAPPHFEINVHLYINNVLPTRWVKGEAIVCFVRSSDLAPLDFAAII